MEIRHQDPVTDLSAAPEKRAQERMLTFIRDQIDSSNFQILPHHQLLASKIMKLVNGNGKGHRNP